VAPPPEENPPLDPKDGDVLKDGVELYDGAL
jgi:hypothetical protein